jgi:hypothetical protein
MSRPAHVGASAITRDRAQLPTMVNVACTVLSP